MFWKKGLFFKFAALSVEILYFLSVQISSHIFAAFQTLNPKLISRKVCVVEKFLNIHTV